MGPNTSLETSKSYFSWIACYPDLDTCSSFRNHTRHRLHDQKQQHEKLFIPRNLTEPFTAQDEASADSERPIPRGHSEWLFHSSAPPYDESLEANGASSRSQSSVLRTAAARFRFPLFREEGYKDSSSAGANEDVSKMLHFGLSR